MTAKVGKDPLALLLFISYNKDMCYSEGLLAVDVSHVDDFQAAVDENVTKQTKKKEGDYSNRDTLGFGIRANAEGCWRGEEVKLAEEVANGTHFRLISFFIYYSF